MVVPIFNSMARIDQKPARAAHDAGAGRFRSVAEIVLPLSKSGIALARSRDYPGHGRFFRRAHMSAGQSASVVSALQNEVAALQYSPAAGLARIMVIIVTLMVAGICASSMCARNWLDEEDIAAADGRRPWTFYVFAAFFALFVLFLYGPMMGSTSLSLQDELAA